MRKQFSEGRNDRKRKRERDKEIAREGGGRLGLTKAHSIHLCPARFGPSSFLHTPMAGDRMGQADILSQDGI